MKIIACLVSVVAVLALIGDWAQTARLVSVSHLFEVNPILGPRPNRCRLHVYFGLSTCMVAAILWILVSDERYGLATGIAGFVAALEFACVVNNWVLGRVQGRLPTSRTEAREGEADRTN